MRDDDVYDDDDVAVVVADPEYVRARSSSVWWAWVASDGAASACPSPRLRSCAGRCR